MIVLCVKHLEIVDIVYMYIGIGVPRSHVNRELQMTVHEVQ